jgi:isoleucyl-tRNA synthetase
MCPVDERGAFTREAGKYQGNIVKKDDKLITADLKEKGALLLSGTITHRYGHCWRCKTPIIYRATEQWFIKISELKEEMLRQIENIDWVPGWAGSARFKEWVENAKDWTVSRQRYWGIPLPIWVCEKCSDIEVIGLRKELEEKGIKIEELHKPFVDGIKLLCKCGGEKKRVPDVLDVWFDSGVAAWASLGYPSERKEFEEWYPTDFITEGHDQTRGWFYSMLGCGLLAFNEVPYRRVLMHGFTLDEKGEKMSKSLGNVVHPEEIIDKYGAEVLRFYVLWANKPWEDLRFNWDEVKVIQRMFNVFWNVYVFATTYMNIDRFDPRKVSKDIAEYYKAEDRWILSRLNSTIKEATQAFESLQIYRATRALHEFILGDLSRWYIPLIRQRTWIEKDDPVKISAYAVLYEVLTKLVVMLAPIAPHITEEMYQNLMGKKESVHLENMVTPDENAIDLQLEEDMKIVRKYAEAEASAREKKGIKRRWPVIRSYAQVKDEDAKRALEDLKEVVETATNTLSFEVKGPEDKIDIPEVYSSASFEFGIVYIDAREDDNLKSLRYAREVVRRIQEMRKEQDLDVEAFIEVRIEVRDREIVTLLNKQRGYISRETRAKGLDISEAQKHLGYKKKWDIENTNFIISINEVTA